MMGTRKRYLGLRVRKLSLLIVTALALAACDDDGNGDISGPGDTGDGGGGSANRAPAAAITASPTSVPAGDNHNTVVRLDGSASSDPDGDALSYSWTVPSGQFVNGTEDTDDIIEVTFPGAAPYTVTLVVEDGRGGRAEASVTISVG